MNINFKFGLGEIVEQNTYKNGDLIGSHLLEVIAMHADKCGRSYLCRYPETGMVQYFLECDLIGDPDYSQELGKYMGGIMIVEQFKSRAANIGDEDNQEVYESCMKWLKDMTRDYGKNGKIALTLLTTIEQLLEI